MMCVNETLPPRARARWLLITVRLSIRSFTGAERTLVAVGTVRLMSMLLAVRAVAPRSTVRSGSSFASALSAGSDSFGTGWLVLVAGWAGAASERLVSTAGAAAFGTAAFGAAAFGTAAFG